ncbi:MAG: ATP-binding protein [Thermoanaerobaculia bacterium]
MRSLRGKVLIGAVLWTAGLISIVGISFPLLFGHRDSARRPHVFHVIVSPPFFLHSTSLLIIAAICMVVGFAFVRGALSPFDSLRSGLAAIRKGSGRQLPGRYPAEVQPLVDELNALLAHSDQAVSRATRKAGDLAHGLKTPLAVLSNEAARLADGGDTELGGLIGQQVERMKRQVDYHLAHARAAASGSALHAQASLAATVNGLTRALTRLHADRGITVESRIAPGQTVRVQPEDLEEMLGNLLDNACKWAKSRVRLESTVDGGRVVIVVDDDGPGIAPEVRESVLERGVRVDEEVPGSGLGLAIVRDLAELYGGRISLSTSPEGGLRAGLDLPSA